MARFLAPLVIVIALLGASPASAGLAPNTYAGQTRDGAQTSSRSDGGSCSVTTGWVADAVLRCDTSKGSARATYLFTLPSHSGSVTTQVNFIGSHSGADVDTKRVSDTQFRVDVTQDGAGRADILSVMIEYYCKKK
jgi:hypothetical protein